MSGFTAKEKKNWLAFKKTKLNESDRSRSLKQKLLPPTIIVFFDIENVMARMRREVVGASSSGRRRGLLHNIEID